jgi:hypothetical protein
MLVVSFPSEKRYTTLSSIPFGSNDKIKINIVFNENAKEAEIRNILNRLELVIVNGPTPEGLYIIAARKSDRIDQLVEDLKGAKIVKFVERAVSVEK